MQGNVQPVEHTSCCPALQSGRLTSRLSSHSGTQATYLSYFLLFGTYNIQVSGPSLLEPGSALQKEAAFTPAETH